MVGKTSPNQDQDSGSTLDQAILAAQRGDLVKARSIAEGGLEAGSADTVPINAFLGMVCARLQDLPAAAGHLAQAHALMPQDITIACNLVALLMDQGTDAEALAVATAELAQADKSLRVARYRAFLAQKLEQFADAGARGPGQLGLHISWLSKHCHFGREWQRREDLNVFLRDPFLTYLALLFLLKSM